MSKDKLLQTVEVARKHNILIFSDEVYRFLEYKVEDRLPALCDIYENGVSVASTSKSFALPGLRIGWIATRNKKILDEVIAFKDYTTICCSAPSQFLFLLALKNKEKILKRNLEIITKNLNTLKDFFSKYKDIFSFIPPKGGTIGFARIKLDVDIEKFCIDLIEKEGVFLLPSTVYDYGNKNFRIGFGRKNMPACLGKFEEYLTENILEKKYYATLNLI